MNEHGALVEGQWQRKFEAVKKIILPMSPFHQNSHTLSQKNQIAKCALDTFNVALAQVIRMDAIGAFSTHFA